LAAKIRVDNGFEQGMDILFVRSDVGKINLMEELDHSVYMIKSH
jgi:hypothetical protein